MLKALVPCPSSRLKKQLLLKKLQEQAMGNKDDEAPRRAYVFLAAIAGFMRYGQRWYCEQGQGERNRQYSV